MIVHWRGNRPPSPATDFAEILSGISASDSELLISDSLRELLISDFSDSVKAATVAMVKRKPAKGPRMYRVVVRRAIPTRPGVLEPLCCN